MAGAKKVGKRTAAGGTMEMERGVDDWAVGESERWLSIIAGGMLGLAALRRGALGGLLLGTAAGFLIHRGVTGHNVVDETLLGGLSGAPPPPVEPGDED